MNASKLTYNAPKRSLMPTIKECTTTLSGAQSETSHRDQRDIALLNNIESEEMDIARKLQVCRNRLQIIGQGNDEEQCAMIKNFFAERNINYDEQDKNQYNSQRYQNSSSNVRRESPQYDLDQEILQLTESQQNEEPSYRFNAGTYASEFQENNIDILRNDKLALERELELIINRSDQESNSLRAQLSEVRLSAQALQKELEGRIDQLSIRNRELEDELYNLQENHIRIQQMASDVNEQREQLANQLKLTKQNQQRLNTTSNRLNSNSSFLLPDKSQVLCDITYDQDSSRNKSFDGRSRQSRSLHRKPCMDEQSKRNRVVDDLMFLLKIENSEQVYSEVNQQIKKLNSIEQFISSLQDMIIKLTPPNTYQDRVPSVKECWRWIKRILGDYMAIKKSTRNKQDIIWQLIETLGVDDQTQIIPEVQTIITMLFEARRKQK